MTDQTKIPAPEPCAWADDKAAAGAIGAVESADTKRRWMRVVLGTHAFRATAERLTHPLCTLAAAETYAAAREAAARQAERERLRGYFREALADTGITWPAEVDILYDRCFSDDGRAG